MTVWSVKGGSGVSVVAAGLATVLAGGPVPNGVGARSARGALLVDLCADQPALFGLPAPRAPGVTDWLAAPEADAEALRRLEVEVSPSLALLPTGTGRSGQWTADRERHLADLLCSDGRAVVVDGAPDGGPTAALAEAGLSLLVIRPCYLALRRAVHDGIRADGVVLVEEAGRALDAADVQRALGIPILCTVPVEPPVARAVDAGLLASRLPRSLARPLAEIA